MLFVISIVFLCRNPNFRDEGKSELTPWPEYELASQSYVRLKGGLDAFPVESRYIANRMQFWLDFVPVIHGRCDMDDNCCENDIVKSGSTGHGVNSDRRIQALNTSVEGDRTSVGLQ